MSTTTTDIRMLRRHRIRRERSFDVLAALSLTALTAAVFWLLPLPARAQGQGHRFECDKAGGAELGAFKTCESKPGRDFVLCVRDTIKASPMGSH